MDNPVRTPLVGVRNATIGTNNSSSEIITDSTIDVTKKTLGNIVGALKSIVTHRYCNGVKMGLAPSFNKRLFQHRFHDHIIRNENGLFRICQHIINNPVNWYNDKMNALNKNMVHENGASYGDESWMV